MSEIFNFFEKLWGQVLPLAIHYFLYLKTRKLSEITIRAVAHFGAKMRQINALGQWRENIKPVGSKVGRFQTLCV